jgi:hypothetical protein
VSASAMVLGNVGIEKCRGYLGWSRIERPAWVQSEEAGAAAGVGVDITVWIVVERLRGKCLKAGFLGG